jgi:hypothetical protein
MIQKTQKKEFKINDFLTLKLEGKKTNIYVNGEKLTNCKFLKFNFSVSQFEKYDSIKSIDDMDAFYSNEHENNHRRERFVKVSPKQEFWGHCSNLQVWVENDYDTRLLHRSLAFSLLSKLAEVGDKKAEKVFKDEIAFRYINGNNNVREYLIKGGYLDNLSEEERKLIFSKVDKQYLKEIREKGYLIKEDKIYLLSEDVESENRIKHRYMGALDSILDSSYTTLEKVSDNRGWSKGEYRLRKSIEETVFVSNGAYSGYINLFLTNRNRDYRIIGFKATIKSDRGKYIYSNRSYKYDHIILEGDKKIYVYEFTNTFYLERMNKFIKDLIFAKKFGIERGAPLY